MLKKINANFVIASLVVLTSILPADAQFFSTPFSPGGNPFTSGFNFAPGVVTTPYVASPFGYGSSYPGFGGGWLARPFGYGNYGGYGAYGNYGGYSNFGNFGYPGGFGLGRVGLGGFGGSPFINGFGNGFGYGGYGYGGFNGYGNYGGYGGFGWGGYGAYGGRNPFTGGASFSPYSSTGELGTLGPHQQVIQAVPSKASGNYYQPSTVDSSASGSYYADTAPQPQQTVAPIRHSGWNSQSNWTSPSGDSNFWGSGGNGLPKDLNSVPWNK